MIGMTRIASATRKMDDGTILSISSTNTEVQDEALQEGMDIAFVMMPSLFACAQKHIDEFDPAMQKIIQIICDDLSE